MQKIVATLTFEVKLELEDDVDIEEFLRATELQIGEDYEGDGEIKSADLDYEYEEDTDDEDDE